MAFSSPGLLSICRRGRSVVHLEMKFDIGETRHSSAKGYARRTSQFEVSLINYEYVNQHSTAMSPTQWTANFSSCEGSQTNLNFGMRYRPRNL